MFCVTKDRRSEIFLNKMRGKFVAHFLISGASRKPVAQDIIRHGEAQNIRDTPLQRSEFAT